YLVDRLPAEQLNIVDHRGITPIAIMAEKGMAQALEKALANGASPDPAQHIPGAMQPLAVAMLNSARLDAGEESAKVLLRDARTDPNVRDPKLNINTLNFALDMQSRELFDLAIARGHAPDSVGGDHSPLH